MQNIGLKKKVFLFAFFIFAMTFLLSMFVFWGLQRYSQRRAAVSHVEGARNEKLDMLKSYFKNMDSVTYNLAYSNWIQDLCQKAVYTQRRQELLDNAHEFLGSVSTLYEGNKFALITWSGIRVTSVNGYYLDYGVDIKEKPWYDTLLHDGKYMEAEEGEEKGIYHKHSEWDMTLYYLLHDYNTLEMTGVFVITIPEQNLKKLLATEYDGMFFGLLCSDGRLVTADEDGLAVMERAKNAAGQNRLSDTVETMDQDYFAVMNDFSTDFFDWKLVTVFDGRYQKMDVRMMSAFLIILLLVSGCLLVVGVLAVSKYLTKPLLACADGMRQIQQNHLGILLQNTYTDEIGELISGFNEMSASLELLVEKNRRITAIQKESEIKLLESQINPHFLFNTLEIINSLILNRQETEAVMVCETLGQLYRYNLRQEKWITIGEELEYTKQYLLIVKYKQSDLEVFFDVDEELGELPFLKMVLQPLVENSIRHGFRYKTRDCCISIGIEKDERKLRVTVMDNGSGMEPDQHRLLMEELEQIHQNPMEKLPDSAHIGLRNVVQRLYLEYGDDFSVIIMTNAGYGLRIEMEIPMML